MKVDGVSVKVELDADDIMHLMENGATMVQDTDAKAQVEVRCRQNLKFSNVVPDQEVDGDE